MIYLVSNTIKATEESGVKPLSVADSIALINSWPVVQFDTETTGLDPHVNKLTSLQFGYYDFKSDEANQIVVDCESIDPVLYKKIIESKLLIGHNIKFDLEFLFNHGIVPLNVYDTMICEQVLYLGFRPGNVAMNLHAVLLRHTGIELDKSYQKKIASKGLTEEGIIYAANDVVYLQSIRKSQTEIARNRHCLNAFTVENRAIPAVAYLEWCGIKLDESKWKEKMKKDNDELAAAKERLDELVLSDKNLRRKFASNIIEPTLFGEKDSCRPKCMVDWNSPYQVLKVFKSLGFNVSSKGGKESVDEKTLSHQRGINDALLDAYFEYKGAQKKVSAYGQNFLNLINPNTGRLHTAFNQVGTVTGRMSSGKNSQNADLARLKKMLPGDVRFVNFQNLPARGDDGVKARACFVAEPYNDFVACDYSAEESRVSAIVWNEKSLIDAFKHGIDTHSYYAKLCFPEELKDIDVHDVKKKRPDLRNSAKKAEFAVNYGSDGTAIAAGLGMAIEKSRAMVSNMLAGMPGMKAFKASEIKFLKRTGFLVLNEKTGHRVYWPKWAEWKAEEDRLDNAFWADYNLNHRGTEDSTVQFIRRHKSAADEWFNKNVLNYPIQGGCAIVLKQAVGDLFEWVVNNNLFNKVLFCAFVHDEIDCECPKEITGTFSTKLREIMEHAARMYYKKLPIPAEASIGDHWIH